MTSEEKTFRSFLHLLIFGLLLLTLGFFNLAGANATSAGPNTNQVSNSDDDAAEIAASPNECDCLPGDANGDGRINIADAIYLLNYVFKGGPAPTPYPVCSGDFNGDCAANVNDPIYFVNAMFKNGPLAVDCETWEASCGPPDQK
jgi:hypothetical protein